MSFYKKSLGTKGESEAINLLAAPSLAVCPILPDSRPIDLVFVSSRYSEEYNAVF